MRFWQENQKLVIFCGLIVVVLLVFRPWPLLPWPVTKSDQAVLSWPWRSPARKSQDLVERLNVKLKDYFPEAELKPVRFSPFTQLYYEGMSLFGFKGYGYFEETSKAKIKDDMQTLREEQRQLSAIETQLDDDFSDLQNLMSHVTYYPYRVPTWEREPGFYFMQRLTADDKELEAIRKTLDDPKKDYRIAYDKTLGLKTETPPKKEETAFLLMQLSIARDVTELALRSGISRVSRVTPLRKPEEKGSSDESFFLEYPVQFDMVGRLPDTMKFIQSLKGVHGMLVPDEKNPKNLIVNRGAKDGLRMGERMVISRDDQFVTVATIQKLEKEQSVLLPMPFDDGHPKLQPEGGDRVGNHFYVLRKLDMKPTQDPILGAENQMELRMELAAVKFKSPVSTKKRSSGSRWRTSRGRGKATGGVPPAQHKNLPVPKHGESRFNYKY